jgi:Protein of unknown function (DUF2442)
MLPRIVDARYAGGHKVWLRFADGLHGEVDLSDQLWGAVFVPLKDLAEFAKVTLDADTDTISWPSGADFSPSWLHHRLSGTLGQAAAE